MSQQAHNRRFVLASRPHGEPQADNFRLETSPIPQPAAGQLLLRTVYLSLDPYMRGRMSDAPSYAPGTDRRSDGRRHSFPRAGFTASGL